MILLAFLGYFYGYNFVILREHLYTVAPDSEKFKPVFENG